MAINNPDDLDRLHTIREVADYLRADPKTVRRWITSGDLASFKVGREWRVADKDLRRFLNQRWNG